MRPFVWTFRYFVSLVWHTWLIWLMAFVSLVALLIAPQGRDILAYYAMDAPFSVSSIFFLISTWLAGLLFCWGSYFLLFFSELRGRLYGEEKEYAKVEDRVIAWRYHDFIQENRQRWIKLYTGFWLFYPVWFYLLSGFFLPISSFMPFGFAVLSFCWCLFWAWIRKANAGNRLKRSLNTLGALVAFWIENFILILKKTWQYWFGKGKVMPISHNKLQGNKISIYSEIPGKSILQAYPIWRGLSYGIGIFSLVVWIILSRLSSDNLSLIGPASLLLLGLLIWTVVFVGLSYLNQRMALPIFLVLVCWSCWVSYINADHPIRKLPQSNTRQQALTINQTFLQWLESRPGFKTIGSDSFAIDNQVYSQSRPFPYLIIAAEGGANRSAMWTALILNELKKKYGNSFDKQLFAIGSVSGGSVGALSYSLARKAIQNQQKNEQALLTDFYSEDYLSSLTYTLFFKDVLNGIWPFYSPERDRAVAFEQRIDEKINQHLSAGTSQSLNFLQDSGKAIYRPLHLVMATEVESGRPSFLANRPLADTAIPHTQNLNEAVRGIRWSGAMHFGARFPIFSPSAAVTQPNSSHTKHYVDGGYYDNGAYQILTELIDQIQSGPFGKVVFPVIIAIGNSYENEEALISSLGQGSSEGNNTSPKGAFWLNETQSVILTLAKTRSANTETHKETLKRRMLSKTACQQRYFYIDLRASGKTVPMNWYLTERARNHILKSVRKVSKEFPPQLLSGCVFEKKGIQIEKPEKSKPDLLPLNDGKDHQKANLAKAMPEANHSPATHPSLYYYSKKQKKWKLKSEADFKLSDLKPLKKPTKQKKPKSKPI